MRLGRVGVCLSVADHCNTRGCARILLLPSLHQIVGVVDELRVFRLSLLLLPPSFTFATLPRLFRSLPALPHQPRHRYEACGCRHRSHPPDKRARIGLLLFFFLFSIITVSLSLCLCRCLESMSRPGQAYTLLQTPFCFRQVVRGWPSCVTAELTSAASFPCRPRFLFFFFSLRAGTGLDCLGVSKYVCVYLLFIRGHSVMPPRIIKTWRRCGRGRRRECCGCGGRGSVHVCARVSCVCAMRGAGSEGLSIRVTCGDGYSLYTHTHRRSRE